MDNIIEIKGLKKSYGDVKAVNGIDFYVAPGTLFAFLGSNGAGKSTTIDIISTLLKPDEEEIIIMNGGELLNIEAVFKVLGITILSTLFSCFMMFFLVSFFNSSSAFAAASTVIGTLIGFLTGVYIPLGQFPGSVQMVVKLFPPAHSAVLLRQIMMEGAERTAFAGAPEEVIREFRQTLGVSFSLGDKVLNSYTSIMYILVIAVVFAVLSVVKARQKSRY